MIHGNCSVEVVSLCFSYFKYSEFGVAEQTLNRLQEVAGSNKTSVSAVVTLWCESHGSTVRSTSLSLLIISSRTVPCQSQQDWSVRSIVVVILLLQALSDHIIHLLVILLSWSENTLCLSGRASEKGAVGLVIDVGTCAGSSEGKTGVEAGGGLLCGWSLGGVCAAALLAESSASRGGEGGAGGGSEGGGCACEGAGGGGHGELKLSSYY